MAVRRTTIVARASSDAHDRLTEAQEPLAGLQRRCGGEVPGAIAIPELRQVVQKARTHGLRLARVVQAFDGENLVRTWVDIIPRSGSEEDELGCEIVVSSWQSSPVPPEAQDIIDGRQLEITRAIAELIALLDSEQRILTVEAQSPDLRELADRMASGTGSKWTEFIALPGLGQERPLHWRLLDEATCKVEGSARSFTAHLVPLGGIEQPPVGFELYLVSDIAAGAARPIKSAKSQILQAAMIGREVAPAMVEPGSRIVANAKTIRSRLAGPITREYSDYASDIASAGEHLLSLLGDLTDLDQLERGALVPARETIDLADAARKAAEMLAREASERAICLVAPEAHETLPANGEFSRTLQILLNLVGNAIRYSRENSTITLSLSAKDDAVAVEVADEGPGLAADQHEAAFAKFERLGRSGDGGSGLGLYISRRLARAMQGDVTVESSPKQGARFTLHLPAPG